MERTYLELSRAMRAFSDPKRLFILDMLSCGERCATELQDALSLTQPTISYHMKLLTETGAVTMRNEGKYVFYSLDHCSLDDFVQKFADFTSPKSDCICYTFRSEPCRETENIPTAQK